MATVCYASVQSMLMEHGDQVMSTDVCSGSIKTTVEAQPEVEL